MRRLSALLGFLWLVPSAHAATTTLFNPFTDELDFVQNLNADVTITGSLVVTNALQFENFDCTSFDNDGALTVDVNGNLRCSNDESGAGGSSEWTDTGTILHPNESAADEVAIGGTTEAGADIFLGADGAAVFNEQSGSTGDFRIETDNEPDFLFVDYSADTATFGSQTDLGGTLGIDGDADEVGLIIQGHTTQTTSLQTWEQSDGTDVMTISNAGNLTATGTLNVVSSVQLENYACAAGEFLRADASGFLGCVASTSSFTSFDVAGDSGSNQTITDGNTLTIAGGTNGIDTVGGATDTVTINFDSTEVGTTTWGAGTDFTWTFNSDQTVDPAVQFTGEAIGPRGVVTWNPSSADHDFIINSDNDVMLLIDGSTDQISFGGSQLGFVTVIGNTAGETDLHIQHPAATGRAFLVENNAGTDGMTIEATGATTVTGTLNAVSAVQLENYTCSASEVLSTTATGFLRCVSASAGSGDITDVGDCSTGACFTGSSGTTLTSNTSLVMALDDDNDGSESFDILDGADATVATIEESGLITTLVGIDAIGAVDFDIGSADVLDVTVVTDGGTIVLDGNLTQDAGTTLFMGGLLDATGAVDMDYGSADITDHTFIEDGGTYIFDNGLDMGEDNITNVGDIGLDSLTADATSITINDATLIDGSADAVQLTVQGNATQTNFLATFEQSDGTDVFTVDNSGNTTASGSLTVVSSTQVQGLDCSTFDNGGAVTADANGWLICTNDDSTAGGSSEWTDTGTVLHPNEQTLDNVAIGGTTAGSATVFMTAASGDTTVTGQLVVVDSLQIPNGTDPNVGQTARMAFDTTSGQLVVYDGTNEDVAVVEQAKCATVENLVAADDDVPLYIFEDAATMQRTACYTTGFTTQPTYTLEDGDGNAVTGAATCNNIPNDWTATTAGNAFGRAEAVRLNTTNTPAPTTGTFTTICFVYTLDRR